MACPVCMFSGRTPELRHKEYQLYACNACGSVYIDPLPDQAERYEMYADPYAGATEGYYAKADKKIRRARKRARILDAYVTTGKSFLEIGSSGGFMVEAMRERGYTCTGVEPDAPGVAYAQKRFSQNTFINGLLEQVGDQLGAYDAVYCSEVIEHVPQPRPFVETIARHMKPGAVVNFTTPDVSHFNRPKDITQWADFNPPAHCIYFTPHALRKLLMDFGLEVFRHRFNWKPGIQMYARKVAA